MPSSSFGMREIGIVSITFHFIPLEPQVKSPLAYLNNIACVDWTLKFAFSTIAAVIHDIIYGIDRF